MVRSVVATVLAMCSYGTSCSAFSVRAFSVTPLLLEHARNEVTPPVAKTKLYSSEKSTESLQQLSRRQVAELSIAAVGLSTSFVATRENNPTDYGLYGVLPVGPYKRKKTIMEVIVPDTIWTFDQKFGILNVQVPLRMTIVKMSGGGLFVYDPIAATPECVDFVKGLVRDHGPVKHIVLGSVAIEHKVYAGVFAQKFPEAEVWLQRGQYSFPIDLPVQFLGFPVGRTQFIPKTYQDAPDDWKRDFDFLTLGPEISGDGAFGETVFFHRDSKTLLCTDTVVEVTDEVPTIFDDDPSPLLYHARDTMEEVVEDTPAVRKKGWRRVVLFGLFFNPGEIKVKTAKEAILNRRPDINPDFAGIYPFDWVGDDVASFKALQGGLLVAPILQQLVLNRYPVETLDFADKVAKWPIERIIPAHLKNNLKYTGKDYRAAFSFLDASDVPLGLPKLLDVDMKFLYDAEANLMETGTLVEHPPLPVGKYSRAEVLSKTSYKCRAGTCTPKASDAP